jgi:thiol-disulfide isomerase/thioredoxin
LLSRFYRKSHVKYYHYNREEITVKNIVTILVYAHFCCLVLLPVSGCGNQADLERIQEEIPLTVLSTDNTDAEIAKKDFYELYDPVKMGTVENPQQYYDTRRAENLEVWKKTAENGVPEGQYLFGVCYLAGRGMPKDPVVGTDWIRKAAEQGLAEAQYSLAHCYYGSGGVPMHTDEAIKWFRKASEQGHEKAAEILQSLEERVKQVEMKLRRSLGAIANIDIGSDFNLYGKTLDNENFDWESLRGKYVLVQFMATWCGACHSDIPGMLDAYEKYHDKGLEIVSVYIKQRESDPVATVKKFVEKEKLPWIIISESLTKQSGQPLQSETFGTRAIPSMVLVDEEGKVLIPPLRMRDYITAREPGIILKQELQKLFDK